MKVGSVVLATDQGLGYLAREFFKHGIIQKVFIKNHSSRKNHYEWYPAAARMQNEFELIQECDTLLFFEEVWDWKVIVEARKRGVKTVLMPMYECTRNPLPYQPDVIISPSLLDQQYYPDSEFIPVPVEAPWRLREKAEVFVHNAGNGGIGGRNGTKELLEAMKYVKSPIKLIVRSQVPLGMIPAHAQIDDRIEFRVGQFDDIWSEGDVFVFPEKFNGLSLPLQEAYASGMLVMAGNRFPINTWLPNEPLIPVDHYSKQRISVEFDSAIYHPFTIALKIDDWFGKDISEFSERGKVWAEENSWEKLKEKYIKVLSR